MSDLYRQRKRRRAVSGLGDRRDRLDPIPGGCAVPSCAIRRGGGLVSIGLASGRKGHHLERLCDHHAAAWVAWRDAWAKVNPWKDAFGTYPGIARQAQWDAWLQEANRG